MWFCMYLVLGILVSLKLLSTATKRTMGTQLSRYGFRSISSLLYDVPSLYKNRSWVLLSLVEAFGRISFKQILEPSSKHTNPKNNNVIKLIFGVTFYLSKLLKGLIPDTTTQFLNFFPGYLCFGQDILSCGNGDLESLLKTVVLCLAKPAKHFAEVIICIYLLHRRDPF